MFVQSTNRSTPSLQVKSPESFPGAGDESNFDQLLDEIFLSDNEPCNEELLGQSFEQEEQVAKEGHLLMEAPVENFIDRRRAHLFSLESNGLSTEVFLSAKDSELNEDEHPEEGTILEEEDIFITLEKCFECSTESCSVVMDQGTSPLHSSLPSTPSSFLEKTAGSTMERSILEKQTNGQENLLKKSFKQELSGEKQELSEEKLGLTKNNIADFKPEQRYTTSKGSSEARMIASVASEENTAQERKLLFSEILMPESKARHQKVGTQNAILKIMNFDSSSEVKTEPQKRVKNPFSVFSTFGDHKEEVSVLGHPVILGKEALGTSNELPVTMIELTKKYEVAQEWIPLIVQHLEQVRSGGRAWTRLVLNLPEGQESHIDVRCLGNKVHFEFSEEASFIRSKLVDHWSEITLEASKKGIELLPLQQIHIA